MRKSKLRDRTKSGKSQKSKLQDGTKIGKSKNHDAIDNDGDVQITRWNG